MCIFCEEGQPLEDDVGGLTEAELAAFTSGPSVAPRAAFSFTILK